MQDGHLACLQEALEIERCIGHRDGQADAHIALARTLLRIGRVDDARTNLEQALMFAREVGHRSREAAALNLLGEIALSDQDGASATACHQRALALVAHSSARREQANPHHGIGQALATAGDETGSARHLDLARELYAQLHSIGAPDQTVDRG